jgi:predicted phage tail protein
MGAKEKGLAFAVFVGKRSIKEEELSAPSGSDDIRIAPVLLGRKNGGMFNVILGVVLIVVGYFAFGSTTQLGASMIASGIASAATGVVQLLSPQPKGLKSGDRPDNQPSYVFNGAVNTQAQGNPVPVLYGRMIVGSAVVSAGIHAEDYAPATAGVGAGVNLLGRNPKNFYER